MATTAMVPVQGALEVDLVTNRGTVTAVMEYVKAPKAVANFLRLAQGTSDWIHPLTGELGNGPYFAGLTFHQVTNTSSLKIAETGSPTGAGNDGPGYQFQDEFDASLTHVPYVLSMSNDGPNTNGSRFVITGNVTLSSRDQRNTVFGKVSSTASRTVVNSILANAPATTVIQSVQVRRTDAPALAFDESAVPLPVVRPVAGALRVVPGLSVELNYAQQATTVLRAYQSLDLISWSSHYRRMIGLGDASPGPWLTVDGANVRSRFYRFSVVENPNAGGVTGFANRTLTVESPGAGTLTYYFNAAGTGGYYENVLLPDEPPFFSGNFQVRSEIPPVFEPYSFRVLIYATGLGGSPFNLVRAGIDTIGATKLQGHQLTTFLNSGMTYVFEDRGTVSLTR